MADSRSGAIPSNITLSTSQAIRRNAANDDFEAYSTTIMQINSPRGFLINGKIVPSVASNNLTVAIKGLDGEDPSATNPVYCRIGDTIRSITSALSVTKNAGTNWCNAGSSELATKEIDYFVYLGYNATDGVVIGFSRIPYATEYDDFSATSTNEKYCAISTITNAAAGDDYENIGRFAATLSAGAGYTWTVPTFTNKNLIQRPIYETRWLDYSPILSQGTEANISKTNTSSVYIIRYSQIFVRFRLDITGAGDDGNKVNVTIPFTGVYTAYDDIGSGAYFDTGTANYQCGVQFNANGSNLQFTACSVTATGVAVGTNPNIATANGDAIQATVNYEIA